MLIIHHPNSDNTHLTRHTMEMIHHLHTTYCG